MRYGELEVEVDQIQTPMFEAGYASHDLENQPDGKVPTQQQGEVVESHRSSTANIPERRFTLSEAWAEG